MILRDKNSGFTLLEVMVAIAILGISLVLIMQLFSGTLSSISLSRQYTEATFLARHKLEELRAEDKLLSGTQEGDFGEKFANSADYMWEAEVSPYPLPTPSTETEAAQFQPQVIQIRLKVSWKARGKTHKVELITLNTSLQELETL
jgi:general secretion pathway protein I